VLLKYQLHGIGHVAQEMKAIGDLHGVGRTAPCTFGVGTRTVATDHCYAGMGLQPLTQGGRFAIGQQRNRSAAFQVYQYCSVPLAFALRPVIDT